MVEKEEITSSDQTNFVVKSDASEMACNLPPYSIKSFREIFAPWGIRDQEKDEINMWWRQNDKIALKVNRYQDAINSSSLPIPESRDSKKSFKDLSLEFSTINLSINSFINAPKPNRFIKFVRESTSLFGTIFKEEEMVQNIASKISDFNEKLNSNDQIIALCEAIKETEGLNDPATMRTKIAQWAFEEMFSLFPYLKINYMYEAGELPSTVDDLEQEKSELISALKGDVWTSKELAKWKRVFNKNRKLMDRLDFETDIKLSFNYIFNCTLGKVSPNISAVIMLRKVEEVWQGIGEDNTLQEVWDYELEKIERKKEEG